MTKIAVILCYFGKLPDNFPLFAESCRRNARGFFAGICGQECGNQHICRILVNVAVGGIKRLS